MEDVKNTVPKISSRLSSKCVRVGQSTREIVRVIGPQGKNTTVHTKEEIFSTHNGFFSWRHVSALIMLLSCLGLAC